MQRTLQKPGPSPYSLSVMAGVLLIAVTAYPKSLDETAFCKEKTKGTNAQCVNLQAKTLSASQK